MNLEAYALYENGLGTEHPRTASLVPDLAEPSVGVWAATRPFRPPPGSCAS